MEVTDAEPMLPGVAEDRVYGGEHCDSCRLTVERPVYRCCSCLRPVRTFRGTRAESCDPPSRTVGSKIRLAGNVVGRPSFP